MSTRARATVAAGCAALTMAAVVAATPASAAATASYYCYGLPSNPYSVHFDRDSSNRLVLQTTLPKSAFTPQTITATFDGHSISSVPSNTPYPVLVQGIYPWTVSAAPSQIVFSQTVGFTYTCELTSAGAGFPV